LNHNTFKEKNKRKRKKKEREREKKKVNYQESVVIRLFLLQTNKHQNNI
jgi:hypothetical protein